ncbi:MATE family efflux transporter [Leadbettera azotonutricia]|uniref:Multidrug export protein MepA n=1 Tax=Leadbettera azotonutricia (strain ATCC BAA-888 / DSM 13862 / ZAS-9) TaxID=545695 RepID=F5YCM6_LEAAZ|nr:MATE family efflux transporter [Leadbettera azotonutricia]AEF83412.1 MATE efflux family protein [Leadbettera azotonutricia ZAS-9]
MPEQKSERFIQMTTAPVIGLVLRLAVPSIVIMLISALYNMADTYFVGSLGTSAVAAVGVSFPLMAIIQAMGFFFGQGSGNYMSRVLGARETEKASCMAATGFISAFVFVAILCVLGLIFRGPLALALGSTPTILPYATEYLFYILLAGPWMTSSMVLNQQLRFQGSASMALVGMVSGAILNIFLDPLFIFVFSMGIKGAAIATMISQMVSFLILWSCCKKKENIPIKFSHFSPSFSIYREMIKGGLPALLRQGLMSIATVIINHMAGIHGDAGIAAISIVNRVYMFAGSLMLGFGQGFQPVCGFNYGAKLYKRLKKAFWFCVRLSTCVLFAAAVLLAIFAPVIIAFFREDDPEVIRIGTLGLRLYCISLPFSAWVVMSNMMTQTMGKALEASILSMSRQGLFLLPGLFILTPLLGLFGIQLALPVADLMAFILAIPLANRVLRQLKEEPAAAPNNAQT